MPFMTSRQEIEWALFLQPQQPMRGEKMIGLNIYELTAQGDRIAKTKCSI